MGFQFFCAASRQDWIASFGSVRRGADLHFYRVGFYLEPIITALKLEEIDSLDLSAVGMTISEPFYYALLPEQSLVFEKIKMNSGETKYIIDAYNTHSSFIFRPGGLYASKYWVISEMSSVWSGGDSVDVARRMMSYARRHWQRGNGYWIGPDCYANSASYIFTEDYRQNVRAGQAS